MDFSALKKPFAPHEIEWRVINSGKNSRGIYARVAAYLTSRAVMDRLDDVVGAGNWRDEYHETSKGEFLCGISIHISDEWITKWDGSEQSQQDAFKGGLSGAFKRAGVKWGIGRYLYSLGEQWAVVNPNGKNYGKTKQGEAYNWDPPKLPDWALPEGSPKAPGNGNKALTYRDITNEIKSIMIDWSEEEKKPFQDKGSAIRKSNVQGWQEMLRQVKEAQALRDKKIPFDEPPEYEEPGPLEIF